MRYPAVSGMFYPSDPEDLVDMIDGCFRSPWASGVPGPRGAARSIRGMMVPHAGYVYSGPRAADAFRRLAEDARPEAYVVIGPDHHGVCDESVLCYDSFMTPLGEVPVHDGICRRLSTRIRDDPRLHRFEHSVEVELPFLQTVDPDARIVPIMMGDQSPQAAISLAEDLRWACEGHDVVVIASTDMSHYVPKETAERLDSLVLDQVRRMDWKGVYREVAGHRITMCGYGPTAVAMMLCEGCRPEGISHSDSCDTGGSDPSSVVGYASAVFADRSILPEPLRAARRVRSMDDGSLGFCTHCGRRLNGGETRCPECGSWLDSAASRAEAERVRALYGRQLRIASAIMLACSVLVLMYGTASYLWSDELADALNRGTVPTWAVGGYWDSDEDAAEYLHSAALSCILSGACGLGAGVLTALRRHYWAAMGLCSVFIIAGPSGIVWLFVEFLAFWMLISARYGFREYESKAAGGDRRGFR